MAALKVEVKATELEPVANFIRKVDKMVKCVDEGVLTSWNAIDIIKTALETLRREIKQEAEEND